MRFVIFISVVFFFVGCNAPSNAPKLVKSKNNHTSTFTGKKRKFDLSGPYAHKNLAIFLVHGKDLITGKKFLTLQEAMQQKKVIVHETGSVNQLAIENTSKDEQIYIQAGDIVKGGKQDRTLGVDLFLKPNSGKVPISSFCVEQGRWSKRSGESLKQFNNNDNLLATKKLKLAVRYAKKQGTVWKQVAETQKKLAANLKAEVQARESRSSMQLTLENKRIKKSIQEYTNKLKNVASKKNNTIGYVFVINNKINSADIYAAHSLFLKLWPKLLASSAVEAIAEKDKKAQKLTIDSKKVHGWLQKASQGKRKVKKVDKRTKELTLRGKKTIAQKTMMKESEDDEEFALHESYSDISEEQDWIESEEQGDDRGQNNDSSDWEEEEQK